MDAKTIRELIEYCTNNKIPIDRYKINSCSYGVKAYDSPDDIPE